jgi:hypothetical protein
VGVNERGQGDSEEEEAVSQEEEEGAEVEEEEEEEKLERTVRRNTGSGKTVVSKMERELVIDMVKAVSSPSLSVRASRRVSSGVSVAGSHASNEMGKATRTEKGRLEVGARMATKSSRKGRTGEVKSVEGEAGKKEIVSKGPEKEGKVKIMASGNSVDKAKTQKKSTVHETKVKAEKLNAAGKKGKKRKQDESGGNIVAIPMVIAADSSRKTPKQKKTKVEKRSEAVVVPQAAGIPARSTKFSEEGEAEEEEEEEEMGRTVRPDKGRDKMVVSKIERELAIDMVKAVSSPSLSVRASRHMNSGGSAAGSASNGKEKATGTEKGRLEVGADTATKEIREGKKDKGKSMEGEAAKKKAVSNDKVLAGQFMRIVRSGGSSVTIAKTQRKSTLNEAEVETENTNAAGKMRKQDDGGKKVVANPVGIAAGSSRKTPEQKKTKVEGSAEAVAVLQAAGTPARSIKFSGRNVLLNA